MGWHAARRSPRGGASAALLLWGLLVLGLYNLGASHADYEATVRALRGGPVHLDAATAVAALRMYLTDDGDVRRYYAYANALLGRPYYGYFVRSAAQWQKEFAGAAARAPDDWPLTTPAAPLRPYRDYLVEYPPGLLLFTVPPALLLPSGDSGEGYRLLFCSEMALLLGLAAWLAGRAEAAIQATEASRTRRFYWLCALASLLLGPIITHRYDAVVSVLLCATAWAALRGRAGLVGAALALAVASKGVPLLTAPIWAAYLWLRPPRTGEAAGPRAVARALGGALLVGLALAVPTLWWCGWAPVEALRYHAARPLQLESTFGALLGLTAALVPSWRGAVQVVMTYGSWNAVPVGATLAGLDLVLQRLSTVLLGLGLGALYATAAWQLRRLGRSGVHAAAALGEYALRAQLAALVLYMVLGRVFSPQYVTWLLPLGLLVARRQRRSLVLLLVAMGLTQVIHPASYAALKELRPWACSLVLVRNLLLLGLALRLLRAPNGPGAPGMQPGLQPGRPPTNLVAVPPAV